MLFGLPVVVQLYCQNAYILDNCAYGEYVWFSIWFDITGIKWSI